MIILFSEQIIDFVSFIFKLLAQFHIHHLSWADFTLAKNTPRDQNVIISFRLSIHVVKRLSILGEQKSVKIILILSVFVLRNICHLVNVNDLSPQILLTVISDF